MEHRLKRQKLDGTASQSSLRQQPSSSLGDEAAHSSSDNEDEILLDDTVKSKKTSKRKLRATSPSQFGATLTSLLSGEPQSEVALALEPHVVRQQKQDREKLKERRLRGETQKDAEEKGRITDVIGGWGGEGERELRKVAQRGVIKLFNAIQQTQSSPSLAHDLGHDRSRDQANPGGVEIAPKLKPKSKNKTNALGKGKQEQLDQDRFLDMIRGGGVVSKV